MIVPQQFAPGQQHPFTYEIDPLLGGRTKMSGRESQRRAPGNNFVPQPTVSLAEAPAVHTGYDLATPRSYTNSPSSVPSAGGQQVAELQPWLFQIFPESYSETPPTYPTTTVENPYISGDSSFIYSEPTRHLSHSPIPSHDDQFSYSAGVRIREPAGARRPELYYQYDDPRAVPELDRDPKRVRLSPFSEYDSSSSEYDPKDRASPPSLSDYSRSPQLSSYSRGSTARSSPAIGGLSPDLSAGTTASLPTSNPSYSHLVATFAAPIKRRKSRRKLEPGEREKVHQLRKMGACTRCWGLKMKCDDGHPCHRCEKLGAAALCVRVHFVDLDVFSKWLVDSYSKTMMHHVLRWTNTPPRTITVSHEKSLGVTLQLNVFEFAPAYQDQLTYWYKDTSGWQSMQTTPFAMRRGINTDILEKYIQDHTYNYVETSFRNNSILAEIFRSAWRYSRTEENFLLRDALQLWTATQLLLHGATLHPTSDALGIPPIPSASSPLANQTPLPRVLSNQLDHLFERRIWQLEKQILSELQKRIFGRKREDWLKIFFTLVVLMNALERDSWRLYYWMFHKEDGYEWRHPSSPQRLIEKNNTLAESLAAHFAAISKGLTPFALDWTREQTAALIGKCEEPDAILTAMERIGRGVRSPDHALRTENVLSHYRQEDESSLDFLYSSKVMVV